MLDRVLVLIGSPRGKHSNSLAIASYLANGIKARGVEVEQAIIPNLVISDEGRLELLRMVDTADLLILAFPLYCDCLPAPVIRALELIYGHRKIVSKDQKLMTIINSGLPEPYQNQVAADICRQFAAETGIRWVGSACVGAGMILRGRPLEESDQITVKLREGLDQAAILLADGKPLTPLVASMLHYPLIPISIARAKFIPGDTLWNKLASPYALGHMYDRPYQQ